MTTLILLAGGIGSRMGAPLPKQYLSLQNKPIALHSFELFLQIPEIREIVVVCDPQYQPIFRDHTLFATPGPRRQDSVYSGFLKATQEMILIHDSARPLIEAKYIAPLLDAAYKTGAAALGIPVAHTIKQCDSNKGVKKTLDRAQLWEIQTPQAIEKKLLQKAFAHIRQQGIDVTDDLSMIEAIGHPTEIVPSTSTNIKITTPFDLLLAEVILSKKQIDAL